MFIGGLNWETTEESLKSYFSQFGEVSECTVMRDSASGRSRGFGFLTFREPKCVNTVMVKEHYLDGKIIDPKRAIPREEQERTSKIFVGGVSQEATEQDFKHFFMQFGRVIDATLMMDKDTGRPRGFGFVTFDGDAAVDATLQGPLEILGKPIEVKRAQPRGNMREGEDEKKFGGRRNGSDPKFGGRNEGQNGNFDGQGNNAQQGGAPGMTAGMSPAMMAQYWQRMQSYFQMMRQNMMAGGMGGQGMPGNPMAAMGMGGPPQMNPAMMSAMMGGMGGPPQGMSPTGSPHPQSPGNQGGMGQMNPAMMEQMRQMQMQQQQGGGGFNGNAAMMNQMGPAAAGAARPGFNATEQLMFEQQKYEAQQARRMQQGGGFGSQGGPTSWEGMYDDVPQPPMPPQGPAARVANQGGFRQASPANVRGSRQGSSAPPIQPSNAPANAPTGPKNAGKPGSNYRGGGRHAGGRTNFHPYNRGN
ncbi:RNA-binding domain-containing protein [Lophium mytilinum]|uniref:RNA-binding domain-containing protein n=1 Tax=Lophium mytilinum TaxID=390894 RepID=A0A6A6QSB0_9PEZI|nr:RNA-binding domain-containing protein [Lophium mytilinum]